MSLVTDNIRERLSEKGLKITPQRIAILEAINELDGHPTAENIIEFIRRNHPNVAIGTVYKVLETLIENDLIKKVTTDRNIMRYDGVMTDHHHLYCAECDKIRDYIDDELNQLLKDYFSNKDIEGFHPGEFILQIKGTFDEC